MDSNQPDRGAGYETSDAGVRLMAGFALSILIGGAILLLGLRWMFDYLAAQTNARQPAASPLAAVERHRLPSEPRLEGLEPPDVARQRQAVVQASLHGYGWVDREHKIVRIPIDHAMNILSGQLPSQSGSDRDHSRGESALPTASNSGRMLPGEQP